MVNLLMAQGDRAAAKELYETVIVSYTAQLEAEHVCLHQKQNYEAARSP